MKTNKYLITVTSEEIKDLKVKNINFLFPITNYSVGFLTTFDIKDIDTPNAYLYLNRIFDNEAIASLEKDLQKLPSNIKGICFTDLGVLQLIKKLNLKLETIYMQLHNTTNYKSINYYLEEVDSLLVSTDITENELLKILDHAHKPLVVPFFMAVNVMYSRRHLLNNFQDEFDLPKKKDVLINEPISQEQFRLVENDLGTVVYNYKYIDYRHIKHSNILYYFIEPLNLTKNDVEKILKNEDISGSGYHGFLDKETYYRLKEETK